MPHPPKTRDRPVVSGAAMQKKKKKAVSSVRSFMSVNERAGGAPSVFHQCEATFGFKSSLVTRLNHPVSKRVSLWDSAQLNDIKLLPLWSPKGPLMLIISNFRT